jgi:Leucine-rich repeat (LRR) protein
MKKLLLILLCLPMIGFGQTPIPDANFEQALINLGYDTGTPNGSVPTANIDTVTYLNVNQQNISDLTGIEDFTALTTLYCDDNQLTTLDVSNNLLLENLYCYQNQLTSLDVSNNTALTELSCFENQLTSIDVSNNIFLGNLWCSENQLTSIDVSNNTALTTLYCDDNQLTTLDVSLNTALKGLNCNDNQLTSLDVRNGNNTNFFFDVDPEFFTNANPNLYCIDVDDAAWSTANWTVANGNIDPQQYFSNNCSGTSIQEHFPNKKLLKVTDLLGRETNQTNQPLFYIYDDGTVEKRIVIE